MSHSAEYLIVAGVAWLRRSTEADWAVTFDDRHVRKGRGAWLLDERRAAGELDGLVWDLQLTELAPPFRSPRPFLRPLASSHLETWPALLVTGSLGDRRLDGVPGHRARLWGRRQAENWRWAHATLPDGRWAHALAAKVAGLPTLTQHGSDRGGPGLPISRSTREGTSVRIGPYAVDAEPSSFIGLTYRDPDGSERYCYHSEVAHLRGPGIDVDNAAFEIAGRDKIDGLELHS